MPRAAKLGKHEGQWCTKAGNPSGEYFGAVKDVSYLNGLTKSTSKRGITVAQLMDTFLAWVEQPEGGIRS
jgi:hypothetical protein